MLFFKIKVVAVKGRQGSFAETFLQQLREVESHKIFMKS
jgi:hypothetical protein